MNAIAFQDHELISRRVKIGNEWQTRTFPVVGGRLRIVHEANQSLSIQTEIIRLEADSVVVKASVQTDKGSFNGTGTAATQRDARLADALVELAETRAIARALRFGGIGVEFTGGRGGLACSQRRSGNGNASEPRLRAQRGQWQWERQRDRKVTHQRVGDASPSPSPSCLVSQGPVPRRGHHQPHRPL